MTPILDRFHLTMVFGPQVRKHCAPLFFVTDNNKPLGAIPSSGTLGLIDTGKKKLLVTCWHVIFGAHGLKDVYAQFPHVRVAFGIGGHQPPSLPYKEFMAWKVDEERRCDLVTFDISEMSNFLSLSKHEFYNLRANRPPQLGDLDILYMAGYPTKTRILTENSVGHIHQPYIFNASQIGQFSFFADIQNFELGAEDLGGISGAPCFVANNDFGTIRLVGFVTGSDNSGKNLQFTYARYIGEDGIIRYMT